MRARLDGRIPEPPLGTPLGEAFVELANASIEARTALQPSTNPEATQADRQVLERTVAGKVAEVVFIQTRHACALRVERARELLQLTSLQRDHPDIAGRVDSLFDALSVMVCEVLLDPAWVEEALATLATERRIIAQASTNPEATDE